MEGDFDLDNILDSLNLTGQYQASGLPLMRDSSLDDQILGDIFFSADGLPLGPSVNNDDISNALIDTNMDDFGAFSGILPQTTESLTESDDITRLITTPLGEMPRQSTIEENLESMNLNQSQSDSILSSFSVQIGSSPVEHKIDIDSILATHIVQQQQRILKSSSSKAKKSSKYHHASSNVGPIDILTSYGGCQPCTTVQPQSNYDIPQQILQFDAMESKKIQIISQPRTKFRPRTQNESKFASHYIRCEPGAQHDYPTVSIPYSWARQSVKNIIEVALVGIDGIPHPYTIDNKSSSTSLDDNTLIFRQDSLNTLYFCVTNDDFKSGQKSFMIEYVKCKQDDVITKELIKNRKLEQSMLRFTRIYQIEKDTFHRDEESTEYSCVMSEAYGDIGVEHMGPKYGPMNGNERVYTLLKGRIVKEDIIVLVTENTTGWRRQLPFTKNGNLLYFSMPPFPLPGVNQGVINITICYKGEELYQSPYVYEGSLDQALAQLNLNESPSTSNSLSSSDVFDFLAATGAYPARPSSRRSTTTKTTKRLNNK